MNYKAVIYSTTVGGSSSRTGMGILFKFQCVFRQWVSRGGKSESLHMKNRRLEIQGPTDQLEDDRSVRALLNNYRSGRPLVVLADNNYALFPFDLSADGYTYVVLGLYWIAHAWGQYHMLHATCVIVLTNLPAELQLVDEDNSVVRYKFAFQWCEGQGDPWWLQGTEDEPDIAQAPNGQPHDREPGVNTAEERDNSTSSRCLRLSYH